MAVVTESLPAPAGRARRPVRSGPDRLTVTLLTLSAFLFILAVLAGQLSAAPAPARRRVIVVRKVYETRVITTVAGSGAGGSAAGGASSVTQSVSSSGSAAVAAPTTRSSG